MTENNCPACGKTTTSGSFCTRVECLTYGSGACVAGPSINNERNTMNDYADRLASYGVRFEGEQVGSEYHSQVEGGHDWTLAEVAKAGGKVTRVRVLAEAGYYDISYVHATLPGDRIVRVSLNRCPSSTGIRANKFVGTLIEWAKEEGVYAKGLGLLDREVRSVLYG